jgi:hypothetical protein
VEKDFSWRSLIKAASNPYNDPRQPLAKRQRSQSRFTRLSGGWGCRNPARDAFGQLIGAQLAAQRLQAMVRTPPL